MQLNEYLKQPGITQKALAEALGVSQGRISHWATGLDQVPAERCKAIEDATGGAVQRHELRPDVFDPPAQGVAA